VHVKAACFVDMFILESPHSLVSPLIKVMQLYPVRSPK